jgi:acetyl-CoA synthetase
MAETVTLETLLKESRTFKPSADFARQANANDPAIYERADADPTGFWEGWAKRLDWFEPYTQVCSWKPGDATFKDTKWFLGGKLNATYNCVDRHAAGARSDKHAIVWEGEPGDVRTLTYSQLKDEVCRTANALKALGVGKGDRVTIYMPMVPELAIAMLACARLGAPHCVVFGGFSADSLAERTNDAAAKVVITADGGWRRGQIVPLKNTVDEALTMCETVRNVLVLQRTAQGVPMQAGRDVWWHDLVPNQSTDCPCEPMDSEDLLYILHTSGSTGKPKGITHTTGGYLTGVLATTNLIFDLKEDDLFFCTADCGWVTGHSYVVYGPMANGATVLMYEGAPDSPDKDRFWRLVEKHRATILYTAPTAIRAFMKWGDEYPARCDLSSLRLLGSVGEPINPEAWIWYHLHIGREKCPIVDTWWQTETGAIMITPLPGLTETKPGSATHPFPGIGAAILSEEGEELSRGQSGHPAGGFLALSRPWPSLTRGIFNDPARFEKTYFSRFPGRYFPGDGAKVDEDGCFWLLGRVDDIMLVAGHNISTMEVESALVNHPAVAEAAVIGKQHPLKGQAISAFVILRSGANASDGLVDELKAHVAHHIGALARPDDIFICADLPKTRSGKIMRRLLRDVAEGRAMGDTTTLADPNVVQSLKDKYESSEA